MIEDARFARFARFARSLTEYRKNIVKGLFVLGLVVSYSSLGKFASSLRLCTMRVFCIAYFLRLPNVLSFVCDLCVCTKGVRRLPGSQRFYFRRFTACRCRFCVWHMRHHTQTHCKPTAPRPFRLKIECLSKHKKQSKRFFFDSVDFVEFWTCCFSVLIALNNSNDQEAML